MPTLGTPLGTSGAAAARTAVRTAVRTALRTTLVAAALAVLLAPAIAHARKGPLYGQLPVRHKQELRLGRIEFAPTFEMTVQADYKHAVTGGFKAEYHLTDKLSIGGLMFFGTGVDTLLTEQIRESLPDTSTTGDPTPSKAQFDDHLNTMPLHGSLHLTLTPWFGKMALFGKAFINFDAYLSGGLAIAKTQNSFEGGDDCTEPDGLDAVGMPRFTDPRNDCPHNAGLNAGINVGAGLHAYINKWVALDLYFRNYMFNDNPSGLDFDGDRRVTDDDQRFLSHLFFGVGVSLFFPQIPTISR